MYSAAVAAQIAAIQTGFELVSLLHLTAYSFPPLAQVQDGASYDFIVVGAGTAGSVVASRLSEVQDINVLLVEAGGDPPLESVLPAGLVFLKRSRYDWNYTSEVDAISGKCHQTPYFEMSQGKMLGGTSSLNYMIYSRGHRTDYDSWAEKLNDDSWKWDNILPYFDKDVKMSKSHNTIQGKTGPGELTGIKPEYIDNILESFKELGHNIEQTTLGDLGYSRMTHFFSDTSRQSSAQAYLTPAKDRTNLHVLKEALVTKINIVDNKAVGVEIVTHEGQTINVKANKEVILSAGAFNSPKILMLSGIGPKEHLEEQSIKVVADLPVGKNLQDHIGVVVQHSMEEHDPILLNPYKPPALSAIGYVALDKAQEHPDYETMSFYTHYNVISYFCTHVYRLSYETCDQMYRERKMGMFTEIVNLNPKSRGEVKLRSADPNDPPIIVTGYLTDEDDLDNLVKYLEDVIPIVNTTHFKNIGAEMAVSMQNKCGEHELWSTEYWKCYSRCLFSGLSNYSGTCAMGIVVDSRLRVYGVENLRVADASIMPTITKGNLVGPTVMIGEKAADMIKEDNKL